MKKYLLLIGLSLIICVLRLAAQSETDMKAWEKYMTPGEMHKMIAQYDGEWNGEVTMWMDPATPPANTTVISKNEMVIGGRYQVSKTTGMMMGMPFEGMSLMGYDNTKKTITSVWVDNFGTGTLTMEGTWDATSKSIILKGRMVDPISGKEVLAKQVIKYIDIDTQEMEMYDYKNGSETKTMAIKLSRKK